MANHAPYAKMASSAILKPVFLAKLSVQLALPLTYALPVKPLTTKMAINALLAQLFINALSVKTTKHVQPVWMVTT
jgi:hypothetical protein